MKLSAFNLKLPVPSTGKVFTGGGPYTDLYEASSREAKRDPLPEGER